MIPCMQCAAFGYHNSEISKVLDNPHNSAKRCVIALLPDLGWHKMMTACGLGLIVSRSKYNFNLEMITVFIRFSFSLSSFG